MIRELARSMYLRFWGSPHDHRSYKTLSPSETFRRIYRSKAWGDNGEPFYSGPGSHGPASDLYCASVIRFIQENQVQSVVDCGCGDFAVGRRIVEATGVRYTGVDVVEELIEHHRRNVVHPGVSFQCADITKDPLPQAELCLIRQVLQHLTNKEVARVLGRLNGFTKVIVSEHVPIDPKSINHDMSHGPDVRFDYGSGIYIDQPPFSLPAKELWKFPLTDDSLLRCVLVEKAGQT